MHRARKRFGQNFLQDEAVIEQIVTAVNPQPGQHLVEIGPGRGALTAPLLAACAGQLDVIELDKELIPILKAQFFRYPKLRLHQADALTFDFTQLQQDQRPLRLIGNLPYNIATPLLFYLLCFADQIQDMTFMLQKEVAERVCAAPGSGAYGRLSIMMQYRCNASQLFAVPATAFAPRPKVESAMIQLCPRKTRPTAVLDSQKFSALVKASFAQRRKTLKNNLKQWLNEDDFERLNIAPTMRAENLALEQFVQLANYWTEKS